MSRQLELQNEVRLEKRTKAVGQAVEYGLVGAVGHAGGAVTGLTIKYTDADCLLVIKAVLAGRPQVAFVGAGDMGACFLKAVHQAQRDELVWRADQWAK